MNIKELRMYLSKIKEKCEREMDINQRMQQLHLEEFSKEELVEMSKILLRANEAAIERGELICNSYNACLDVLETATNKDEIETQEPDSTLVYMGKDSEA